MAAVDITISGVLYDKVARTTTPVSIVGEASLTGLGVGGGPIVPGEPPGIWGPTDPRPTPPIHIPPPGFGHHPAHPIVLPPNVPAHPIVIPPPPGSTEPPDLIIWPPLPNNDLPVPPIVDPCHRLVYSLRYGWALVQLPRK